MLTDVESAYVAGLLEGEGCFDGNAGSLKYPRIRIEMIDHDVIERLQALIGGRITYPRRRQEHWKQTALLVVNGRAKVEPTLRAIRPWLGTRRAAKVDILLAAYD